LFIVGIAGFFPIHPRTYMTAWRNRKKAVEKDAAEKAAAARATAEQQANASEQPSSAAA
jgi:small subunit ribosomal protein S16